MEARNRQIRTTRTLRERLAERNTDAAIDELRAKLAALRASGDGGDPAVLALFFCGVVERIATGELSDPVFYAQEALAAGEPTSPPESLNGLEHAVPADPE